MTHEDKVRELVWQHVAQLPEQLEADVTGEGVYLDRDGMNRRFLAETKGLRDAVIYLAAELDRAD